MTKEKEITPESLYKKLPDWLRELDPSRFLSNNYVVLDFETTIIDKGSPYEKDNRIVCSGYRVGPDHPWFRSSNQEAFKLGNEFDQGRVVEALEAADFWVAHNAKFEYGWLERCGLPLENTIAFCTMIAEYVLLANRSKPNMLGLNACLHRRNMPTKDDLGSKLLKSGICPSTWPVRWLKRYQMQDVNATEQLFLNQRKALDHYGKLGVYFTRVMFTAPLVDIEKNGMHLDSNRVTPVYREYTAMLRDLEVHLDRVTGGANPRSVPQMREVLYEQLKFPKPRDRKWLTTKGEPTTSFDYINTLTPRTKKQKRFKELKQEHSKVNAALTKCLNKFQDCITETKNHILTASLNQTVTVTQRLSSSGKNYRAQFQNFPRIFKPLFSARHPGWKIGEIDQAQLEYRVAVYLGQDKNGLYDIQNKVDSHNYTAEKIFGDDFTSGTEVVRKELRTKAKAHTFKPLYGGQSGSKNEVRYYRAFQEKHQGVTETQFRWKQSALNTGKVTIPSGLTFYFPHTRITEDGYITNSTNICNYPVQSFATADIVPVGVTYQWHLMRVAGLESFLVNTIHDSSIGEVHPDELETYQKIGEYAHVDLVYKYLRKVYNVDFNVPLEIEAEFHDNWADNKDWRDKYLTTAA